MRAVSLPILGLVLVVWGSVGPAWGEDLPPAAQETLDAHDTEVTNVHKKAEAEIKAITEKTVVRLKALQDRFCKDALLDEAVAIRDQVRQLQGGPPNANADSLPTAARETLAAHDKEVARVQQKAEAEVKKAGDRTVAQLKLLQDRFCKDARLDEAVAIRDRIRALRLGVKAQSDPGTLHADAADIGKVWYFEVVGNTQGSTWGTDVYTSDSPLATTAVHAGVLRVDQKGIIKVTILPGQASYEATTRNGVTSYAWGGWGVSFKVERALLPPAAAAKK